MSTSDVVWYARRLRAMGPAEIVWRGGDAMGHRTWAREQVVDGERPPGRPKGMVAAPSFGAPLPRRARDGVPTHAARSVVASATGILAGDWDVLGVPRTDIGDPDWFLDEVTGVRAPSRELAFRINHRDEARVGNIKSLWEVSRHHHLTLLAAAWWLTEDECFAAAVDSQLRSWWRQNPFLSGVHWTSGIELGIRLISWAWVRRLLDSWSGVEGLFERNDQAAWQLYWHQRYLARFRSRGSSANNHVIAEAAGLVVASNAFPWYAESTAWQNEARTLLERELGRNTFPSGVNRELASEYHGFVTELALVAAVETAAAGRPVTHDTWTRIGRSLDAAAALVDVTGRPPRQGDGDDGRVLVVDAPEELGWPQLLAVGEALLGRADWWPAAPASVASVALSALFGPPDPVPHAPDRPDRFEDAGITLLRTAAGDNPELWCRCDGGPHGFLSIAAHAHADALSIELRCNGVDILADPGTYCYHSEPEWRGYFRSTIGHNTLEVGGVDQSESGGPFLWTRQARTCAVRHHDPDNGLLRWSAQHHGYARRPQPTVHRRTVTLDTERQVLAVEDVLESEGAQDVRLAWHLGPAVTTDLSASVARLTWSDAERARSATLTLPEALRWTSHQGQTSPVLGWYSPAFGSKVPATTLIGQGRVAGGRPLSTLIGFTEREPVSPVRSVRASSGDDSITNGRGRRWCHG